ncbi:MAG: hypothetical protein Q8P67_09570 [archaeon]|nr:hypothetical protein [archaeon]
MAPSDRLLQSTVSSSQKNAKQRVQQIALASAEKKKVMQRLSGVSK